MTDIVRYLQDYPFLLVTIAGLATLTSSMAFDLQKLLQFKLLLYAVVLAPILLQFFLELRRAAQSKKPVEISSQEDISHVEAGPPTQRVVVDTVQVARVVSTPHPLKLSKKAVFSILTTLVVGFGFLGAISDKDLIDSTGQLGLLIFEAVPFGLGLASFIDARKNKVSKPLAIMSFLISSATVLSSVILLIAALRAGK